MTIMLIAYLPIIYHLIFTLSFRMLKNLFYNLRVSLWMSVQVSGRDAAALDELGYKVIAVEPSEKMRNLASSYYKSNHIIWLDDSLPFLHSVKAMNLKFDLILVSAVWMHLSKKEQKISLETLTDLLTLNGRMIITLRLGPPEPDRNINVVNTEELLELASQLGLKTLRVTSINKDSFQRNQITWQKVVLSKNNE
ncbi:class I SAM-dependent methyltransferase [Escherichia coli]|nr:class I SAM-dependent methyltransferase [Escherichia coli]UUF27885.1 class I SAM-dependent methyltransferase [Escherichia coli]